jgi:tetratricopeptide (TPR) repeat protein
VTEPQPAVATPKTEEAAPVIEAPQPEIVPEAAAEESLADLTLQDVPEIASQKPAEVTIPPAAAPIAKKAGPVPVAASADPLADLVSDVELALDELDIAAPAAPAAVSTAATPSPEAPAAPLPSKAPPVQVVVTPPASGSETSAVTAQTPDIGAAEAHSMLTDLLDELKEDSEEPAEDSDPETHYNLGVAFREMGLLDEAIGELQKVCHAIESGRPFSQVMQAYTWLAQCLVDKGAPQAAIRWYERALRVSGIGEDSRLAVHYDMAAAFEAAGNRKAALDNFMEVYGSNIDYRDVAERIRELRQ